MWAGKMSDGLKGPLSSEASKAIKRHRNRVGLRPGMNLGVTRLLPRWCPAYRQQEFGPGSRVELVKARLDTATSLTGGEREISKRQNPQGAEYRCGARWRTHPGSR